MNKVKVKGAPDAVKRLLSGGSAPVVGGGNNAAGHMETRNKVKQEQRYNVRQRPEKLGPLANGKASTAYKYAEQPSNGF